MPKVSVIYIALSKVKRKDFSFIIYDEMEFGAINQPMELTSFCIILEDLELMNPSIMTNFDISRINKIEPFTLSKTTYFNKQHEQNSTSGLWFNETIISYHLVIDDKMIIIALRFLKTKE